MIIAHFRHLEAGAGPPGRGRSVISSKPRLRQACHAVRVAKKRKPKKRNPREKTSTSSYTDAEGNTLVLRDSLSEGSIVKVNEQIGNQAYSVDDLWQRRTELVFERLAVSWEIAGLPLDDQKMLLGRYRMADPETRRWVRETIDRHVREHIPDLA